MITRIGIPFGGLKKGGFSGSDDGMRFFMKATSDEEITVWIYPEPYCFEETPEEQKTSKSFPYSDVGIDEAVEWLNERRKVWNNE